MPKTHFIKLEREFVYDVLSGKKKAEIRYNDRLYQKGDHIKFEVVKNGAAVDYETKHLMKWH